jgi:hypothetical protein
MTLNVTIMNTPANHLTSRRDFLKTSALAGSALAGPALMPGALAARENTDTLRVGLIDCGDRGSGAANQALNADKNVVLTAMGDAFEDRSQRSLQILKEKQPGKVKVTPENCFVGLDAYQKVIDSGVDVVLLATPPGFRPVHLKAAVGAGKHARLLREAGGYGCAGRPLGTGIRQSRQREEPLAGGRLLLALLRHESGVLPTDSRGRHWRHPCDLFHVLCLPDQTDASSQQPPR